MSAPRVIEGDAGSDPGESASPDAGDSPTAQPGTRGPGGVSPRRASMTSVARTPGLLRREDLLAALDRATQRKVTVISAPPGSGKTSLLRAWSERATASMERRVAFVSVPR